MDFISAAQIIIPELSRLAVTVCEEGSLKVPEEFEKHFCFMPGRQPLFTASGLLELFSKKGSDKIYLSVDALGIHCVFIEVESSWIILGPFAVSSWKDGEARKRLSAAGARDDTFLPYKNYYCSLPIVSDEYAVRTAAMLLVQTVGNPPREVEYLDSEIQKLEDIPLRISESYEELSVVERRYELEEQLMNAVRQGRTAQALRVYSDIYYWSKGLRFMSDRLEDQIAGASTLRTLVRHAALQAGLTPVLVDTLSQEYAQKMHAAADSEQLMELIKKYIAAFCAEVRKHNKKGESPQVRRAIQYIEAHLSRSVTVDELCAVAGVSRQRFVRIFKAETGLTIKQYIAKVRCDRAGELLKGSKLSIRDIASYIGYEDANYFSRIFKSVTHLSPQEYREKNSIK